MPEPPGGPSRVHATSVQWPVGLGGKGNEGVTQQVKGSPGAIGYVELIYALSNGLPAAEVKNGAGAFVAPTLKGVSAAAAGVDFPASTDFRVSITNAPGADAYPISSFTWLLVHANDTTSPKQRAIRGFILWMLEPEAQRMQQAARVSDYTGFFDRGQLIEFDETERIFTKPANQRTEAYITGRFG